MSPLPTSPTVERSWPGPGTTALYTAGMPQREPLRGHTVSVKAIAATTRPADGSAILVSGCECGEIRYWGAQGGEQIGETARVSGNMISELEVVELSDTSRLLVCLDMKGNLYRRDPFGAWTTDEPITVGQAPTGLATHVDPDGRPIADISLMRDNQHGNSTTRWRLDDGTRLDDPSNSRPGIIGVFPVDGRILEVIASAPGAVTIRDQASVRSHLMRQGESISTPP